MKFVHIADMHFDSPFINLSDKGNFGDLRRLEQRNVLKKVIKYIKENDIKYLFISGDFYEQKYIKRSTIEFINNLFKEIENTYIFIAPGNHDPIIKSSYYNQFEWNKNVKIFNSKIEIIETEEINIYGFGFDDFYCNNSGVEEIKLKDKNKINILISHGTLDAGKEEDKQYNPISSKKLKQIGFDYIALGHIHKISYNDEENQNIVYPGSTISLGFDELGEHGMIVGNVEKSNITTKFVKLDDEEFIEIELNITETNSKEELIENINLLNIKENQYVKIILKGNRNFEINTYELLKLISNERIIKIKDKTQIAYNLEKMATTSTLRGLFAKEMLKKLSEETDEERKEIIEKAIEIGLESLE